MRGVLDAMSAQNPTMALEELNELIARGEQGKKPEVKNLGLLYLERASILQSIGRYDQAAEDLRVADEITELLDLTPQGARNAAEYLFNDSAKIYHAPIYEKLLINVLAVYSYLEIGDRQKAMTAARRIVVMTEFFENADYHAHPMLGISWFTAGLAMEMGGRGQDARFFYRKASETLDTPLVNRSLEQLGEPRSEIVSVVLAGLGPYKEPVRFPIGVVVGWVNDDPDFSFSDDEINMIGNFSAEELLTWVNFPVLKPADYAYELFRLQTSQKTETIPMQANVAAFAVEQWEEDRAAVAWSAVTRALTRIATREALQASGRAVESESAVAGGLLRLGGLIAQGAMQAADIPDTRAWNMMPAAIYITRTTVPPGPQEVMIEGRARHGGVTESFTVNVPEDGTSIVVTRLPY
jgi:tetratricopeptide (TPR) repeat protein